MRTEPSRTPAWVMALGSDKMPAPAQFAMMSRAVFATEFLGSAGLASPTTTSSFPESSAVLAMVNSEIYASRIFAARAIFAKYRCTVAQEPWF